MEETFDTKKNPSHLLEITLAENEPDENNRIKDLCEMIL